MKQEKHDVLSDNDFLKFNGIIGIVVKEQRHLEAYGRANTELAAVIHESVNKMRRKV